MKKVVLILLFLIVSVPASGVAGPIYVYKIGGVTRFSSSPPPAGVTAKVFTAKSSGFSVYRAEPLARGGLFRNQYRGDIRAASVRFGVEEALIKAVIHAESAFNPGAVSHKGARGLMQIMPTNFSRLGVSDPHSPRQNIFGGVKLLAMLIKKYGGNLTRVLAAYNAGEGAVETHGGVPPFAETRAYIKKVLELRKRYAALH